MTPDVNEEFIKGRPRPLAEWEFSDGTLPWILDFLVAPGHLRPVLVDLRDEVFKDYEHLMYYRFKGMNRICKLISRAHRNTFVAQGRVTGEHDEAL